MAPLAIAALGVASAVAATPAGAATFAFSTGNPDGRIGTLSRPAGPGAVQTETADDFALGQVSRITHATFIGLLPTGTALSSVRNVEIEFYNVFPGASADPPSGNVPTRANSPADFEIASATRDGHDGSLTFATTQLDPSFTVANTVVDGINRSPGQFTGGEGPATGQEVLFDIQFTTPVLLGADHFFFRPEVELADGQFLWLSAPKPILAPGTPLAPDFQAWMRNDNLVPDWLRIGTDITHQAPFNMAFSLDGVAGVPEPGVWAMMLIGLGAAGVQLRRARARAGAVT
ncbi:PEP-CTERM sorting domain-containing protein [Phenylobacterium sp.]|uniref:PEP-CTERM sorting domain-containing protein n=1 Tax=Phenylobacterium sp. TaxID=1871053 RepID=UPI0025D8EEC8|nr:PEP-CTERM sorting domain-containing protein [Phenylobacterium sp.]